MVAADTEQVEVNSPATTNTRTNNAATIVNSINAGNDISGVNFPTPSLGRQSSIYSLTLDEFQNTLCESGKNFGSMNMDEFLNSIWTAEENQNHPQNAAAVSTAAAAHALAALNPLPPVSAAGRGLEIARQPSLSRQGSLSLPAPLCLKTVEEVWSEIHRGRGDGGHNQSSGPGPEAEPGQQRQHTFGEMTLEDFLVKAGVVRTAPPPPPPPPPPPAVAAPQFGMYQNRGNHLQMGHTFGPVMTVTGSSTKINNGYVPVPVPVPVVGPTAGVCYGNGGGGGYGAGLGMASPVSPLGSEGLVDGCGGQYGMDVGALRARKRTLDGPVEKVVERRQRRMIKNRESAARSRARKQAYTVELEAELNQLREENTQLKQALAELERQQDQQCVEEQQKMLQSRAHKAQDRLGLMRRIKSCEL